MSTALALFEDTGPPECQGGCGKPGEDEDHTCPYNEDVNNDSASTCNCCDDCAYQCAMDI